MDPAWAKDEQKVLNAFLDGDRILRLPAKQKKRLVVLRWLLEHIEPEERFPERNLNALIARHHPDFATIRRELVEFGFMEREHGVYWRVRGVPENPRLEQD
jgi:hypothetical protein